jgi:hypothetical protein
MSCTCSIIKNNDVLAVVPQSRHEVGEDVRVFTDYSQAEIIRKSDLVGVFDLVLCASAKMQVGDLLDVVNNSQKIANMRLLEFGYKDAEVFEKKLSDMWGP